jgi:2,5-diamino-6-(ribosylamino)-4(3H)-pyrimidinone 5'-phosphate reductase
VKSDDLKRKRKEQGKDEHPIRVIVDSTARIPLNASVLHKGEGVRVVAVSRKADPVKVAELKNLAKVIVAGEDDVDLRSVLDQLGSMGIRHLMVEGGGTLIASLFGKGLIDEIYTFVGNIIIGGADAPTPADGGGFVKEADFPRLALLEVIHMGEGIVLHWNVKEGNQN